MFKLTVSVACIACIYHMYHVTEWQSKHNKHYHLNNVSSMNLEQR